MLAYLPCHETNCFYDGRLDNLLPREDTPGDGIRTLGSRIRPQVSMLINDMIGDAGVPLEMRHKNGEEFGRHKELEVCLTPALQLIRLFQ